ncbi:hypothetical protein GIB67_038992 [Kingdonia uniflora]|uniref:Protein kinase domain-containing protein n=1 Tax=Kingdonia uniflora TaxID=39325 RepID=A0A7J7P6L3_9MAGN|nr:hypothetical protein GIB67_038992 [Kingdonia uniflora]
MREKLSELHGNSFREVCPSCGAEYLRDFEVETIGMKKTPRRSSDHLFGARLKDKILDWENALPTKEMIHSEMNCTRSDFVLCLGTRSKNDGKQYTIKAFHKSHLLKLRVAPSEIAMTDVLREVMIMKILGHPNIINLIEVIDNLNTNHFCMGKSVCEGSGPSGILEEKTTRKYRRDVVAGLMYLHAHNILHGDIKPNNLLVTSTGTVKIGDFIVSQVFEVQIPLEVVDLRPSRDVVVLDFSYKFRSTMVNAKFRLPAVLSKVMQPISVSSEEFFPQWRSLSGPLPVICNFYALEL